MHFRGNAFTLLEICLALMIGLLLITLAVPGIVSALAERRLKHSFEVFDGFVQNARLKSVREHQDLSMAWDEKGVTLASANLAHGTADRSGTEPSETERFVFEDGQKYVLERPAALVKYPPGEWIFWKNGICEPAQISFQGSAGKWTVRYDALTASGVFLDSEVK